ncbi:MerR family transcriptional regulator [Salipiger mucosus]|uniref:Transcriptional regulator, MerR family n=1 Tax=Salipiger mucosus DSM 16094 TaxID=1123237 RepID=S9QVN0_9RHOB|nr:MerR family transcriptional regulator [Salipiger mucosus]EPX83643.1 Transcriptional regulator, MerR family [Salipiger mucosus DSM 16094]
MSKSRDAFRTISEVAELLDTPAHVLRFWESKFTQVKPVKRAGGRRYYRPGDIGLLAGIKKLLHDDGMTIKGVQKVLREKGVRHVSGLVPAPTEVAAEEEVAEMIEDAPYTEAPEESGTVLPFVAPDSPPRAEPTVAESAVPDQAEAPEAAPAEDGEWPEAEPSDTDMPTEPVSDDAFDAPEPISAGAAMPPEMAPEAEDTLAAEIPGPDADDMPGGLGAQESQAPEASDAVTESEPALGPYPVEDTPSAVAEAEQTPTDEHDHEAGAEAEAEAAVGSEPTTYTEPVADAGEGADSDAETWPDLFGRGESSPPAAMSETPPNPLPEFLAQSLEERATETGELPADTAESPEVNDEEVDMAEPVEAGFDAPGADSAPADSDESESPEAAAEPPDMPAQTAQAPAPAPLPELRSEADLPTPAPGPLAHLARVQRLDPERAAALAPHVAALRALVEGRAATEAD